MDIRHFSIQRGACAFYGFFWFPWRVTRTSAILGHHLGTVVFRRAFSRSSDAQGALETPIRCTMDPACCAVSRGMAMRFLTLDHLKNDTPDKEFVISKSVPLAVMLASACLCLTAAAFAGGILPRGKSSAEWLWGLAGLFFLWTAIGCLAFVLAWRSRFWLCRTRGDLIWFQCSRSIAPLVIELNQTEVAWIEPVKLTFKWKYPRGGSEITWYYYLDIGLTESAADVLEKFAQDDRISPKIRDQIAPAPAVFNQIARRLRPGVIRINWQGISPGLKASGKLFSQWTTLRPLRREQLIND
jgi:hypothetical protein